MALVLKKLRERVEAFLSANFTTTLATAVSTNLTFQALANEVWVVDVQMTVQCSAAGGVKLAIGAPAGATVEGWFYSSGAAILTLIYQRITAINTLLATLTHTVATTPAGDVVRFLVTIGATPGAVTIQLASGTAGQTTTAFAGSWMKARRVL